MISFGGYIISKGMIIKKLCAKEIKCLKKTVHGINIIGNTKFLKSSRLLQVVSELTNILNFPEGFKIFKIHHSRQNPVGAGCLIGLANLGKALRFADN